MVTKYTSVAPLGFDGHSIEIDSDATRKTAFAEIVGMGNKAIYKVKKSVKMRLSILLPGIRQSVFLLKNPCPRGFFKIVCERVEAATGESYPTRDDDTPGPLLDRLLQTK